MSFCFHLGKLVQGIGHVGNFTLYITYILLFVFKNYTYKTQ